MTHLSYALSAFLSSSKATATALARSIGVHQATISRIASGDRPATDTLRALCTRWPDQRASLSLLIAHLRDEVDRAGREQAEVSIEANAAAVEDDIRLLELECAHDKDLRAILHDLAQMVRKYRSGHPLTAAGSAHLYHLDEREAQAVAEDPPKPKK